jgi:hypothetical protein
MWTIHEDVFPVFYWIQIPTCVVNISGQYMM